jgi:hypothetical protein
MSKRGIHHERVLRLIREWRKCARYFREKANGYNVMAETRRGYSREAIAYDRMAKQLYREVLN